MRSIIDLFGEVVNGISGNASLTIGSYDGKVFTDINAPIINYIFGNAQYIKDKLNEYSQSNDVIKFPLVALFTPVKEKKDSTDYECKANVSIIIACSTRKEWDNEQRLESSFKHILRPIYIKLLDALRNDERFEKGYEDMISHEYSENYSYGRYGAYADDGKEVSEPIDAIDIRSMELTVKKETCR